MVHNYKAFAVQLSDDDHKSQVLPHGSGNNASALPKRNGNPSFDYNPVLDMRLCSNEGDKNELMIGRSGRKIGLLFVKVRVFRLTLVLW